MCKYKTIIVHKESYMAFMKTGIGLSQASIQYVSGDKPKKGEIKGELVWTGDKWVTKEEYQKLTEGDTNG